MGGKVETVGYTEVGLSEGKIVCLPPVVSSAEVEIITALATGEVSLVIGGRSITAEIVLRQAIFADDMPITAMVLWGTGILPKKAGPDLYMSVRRVT